MKNHSTSGLILVAALMAGCATPGAPGVNPNPTSSANNRFDTAAWQSLRTQLESRGWSFTANSFVRNSTTGATTDARYFVSPQSIVRHGATVRARVLASYAAPIRGPSSSAGSAVSFQEYHCGTRTYQMISAEFYADTAANTRTEALPRPLPRVAAQPGSVAETLLNGLCTGRFAQAGTVSATPFPPVRTGGSGSGIALADRIVLTNAHVVSNCSAVDVMAGSTRHPATLGKVDASSDLALLRVPTLNGIKSPSLRRQATVGEGVMTAGFPLSGTLGSDLIVTDGLVNSLAGLRNNASQLQFSAPVQPGNSGGPLLDRGGNVLGVVSARLNSSLAAMLTGDIAQNVNFAIKPEIVGLFLQSENLPLGFADKAVTMETQAVAARARDFTMKVDCKP